MNIYRSGGRDASFALLCLTQNIYYYGFTKKTAQIFIESGMDILDNEGLSYYKLPPILIQSLVEQNKYDKVEELMNKYRFSDSCYTLYLLPKIADADKNAYNLLEKAFYSKVQTPTVFSIFVLNKIWSECPKIVKNFIISSSMTGGDWCILLINFIFTMWSDKPSSMRELLRLYLAYHCVEDISTYPIIKEQTGLYHQLYISCLRFDHPDIMTQREIDLCSKIERMLAQGKSQRDIFREYEVVLVYVVYTLSFFAVISYLLPDYAEVFSKIAEKLYVKKNQPIGFEEN